MTLHRHEPISEEEMNHVSPNHTICETLRGVYHEISRLDNRWNDKHGDSPYDDFEEIRYNLRIATSMAKAMTNKLESYKRNSSKGMWDENEKYPYDKKPIDVLFLTYDDNCNTGYRFWMCAKYLGLNAVMFKGKAHPFGYPMQAPIHPSLANKPMWSSPTTVPAGGIESLVHSAKVVHLIASFYPMAAINWQACNVVVQHGGTVYRQHPDECNDIFNQIGAQHTIIQCPDLLGLGAKNESWIYYPVDTVKLQPDFRRKNPDRLIIGHFPSNPEVKGTGNIETILGYVKDKYPGKFEYIGSTEQVSWQANLDRMRKCDIYIEGCNAAQGNKVYGEFANAGLEASALGCAVITHCLSKDKYEAEFGQLGPIIANNAQELEQALSSLLEIDDITPIKKRCRAWAENNHSIPVTANRLWDKVYKNFF
jgi:hypothetical protein